jgi:hypothetical protein
MDPAPVAAPEGAWIFLSHSNHDWPAVREIRNVLEQRGHRPLLFFLKCLNDHAELHDLIRREIEARTWFLLCDSQAARQSRWVREEMELIRSIPGKYSETVNLDRPLASQLDRIDALCRRATVYLSYARDDTKVQAAQLINVLSRYDYHLRGLEWDIDFENVQASIQHHIDDALAPALLCCCLVLNRRRRSSYAQKSSTPLPEAPMIERASSYPSFLAIPRRQLRDSARPLRPGSDRSAGPGSMVMIFKPRPTSWSRS